MNYWIFECDPKKYRLEDRLEDPDPQLHLGTQHREEVCAGDVAFIWKNSPNAGICATMSIDSDGITMEDYPHERPFYVLANLQETDPPITPEKAWRGGLAGQRP
jgi:hypothetical protein